MAANALLVDTDVLIDYLKGVRPAVVLLDSSEFDFYYSSWTRKELLTKPGLRDSERHEIEALLQRLRILTVDDAIAEKYWMLLKKYESRGLRQADALIALQLGKRPSHSCRGTKSTSGSLIEIELAPVYSVE